MQYDLTIINGQIIDGTGKTRFKANINITNGKIAKIDSSGPTTGKQVIDARGLIVCPGFIDMHSHADLTLFGNRRADSFIRQGVTTLYVTPDGWSPAPVIDDHRRDLKEYYETLTFGAPLPFTWTTYKEYFSELQKGGLGVNIRANIGFGTVRTNVLGYAMRAPTQSELDLMKEQIHTAFLEGVCGLSTGLSYHPQCYSTTKEVEELCHVAAQHGGLHHTHTRGGTAGLREAIVLSERTGIPVNITHTTPSDEQLAMIESAVASNIDVTFDAYPYTAGSSFLSGIYLPGWVHEGGRDQMLQRITNPSIRERIQTEWQQNPRDQWPNGPRNTPLIAWCHNPAMRKYEGKTIDTVAEMMDVQLVDAMCNLLLENHGSVMRIGLHARRHRHVQRAYQHPLMLVGSDGWAMTLSGPLHIGYPHPRCYGTFPKVLGMYVRLMGLLTLEEAITKMTSASAQRMRLEDRGVVRKGMAADITIFNPKTIIDNATYWQPHQYPAGIEYVIVNGQLVIDHGQHTGTLAGQVLRFRSKLS
jgi:N-acyl-D-aspartate/D-glutamate deacylase